VAKSIRDIAKTQSDDQFYGQFDDSNKKDFLQRGEAPALEFRIAEIAAGFIQAVIDNLDRLGKTDTGELRDGISSGDIIKVGALSYEVAIGYKPDSKAAGYYAYVDKGVQGVKRKDKAPNSPFKYRNLGVPPVMADALEGWVKRNAMASVNEDQRKNLSALQVKRKQTLTSLEASKGGRKLTPERRLAKEIGRAIKWAGLPTTNYLSDPIEEYFRSQDFSKAISAAVAADIRIYIRQAQRG
jgi:hypothetical protein